MSGEGVAPLPDSRHSAMAGDNIMWRKAISVAVASAFLMSCKPSYEDQVASLTKHLKAGQLGSSNDFWLVKHNFLGQDEPVAVVFGFTNDADFCMEVAELYMRKYPASEYKCRPAN